MSSSASSRRTVARRQPPSSTASRSCREPGSTTAARRSRRWTSTRSSRATPTWRSSTSWPTRTFRGHVTRSAGRTSRRSSTAGITVISTLNIQHLESVNDVVEQITGIKQQETIPDAVVRKADQIELVDMAPEAIRRRMAHGNIYPAERIDAALGNYFRTGNLGALRELALLWVADRVDDALLDYRERHGIDRPWETRERVVVALTGSADGDRLVRRAARMAARSKGDLFAVHVRPQDGLAGGAADRLDRQRELVEELGGTYREVVGADIGETLVATAHTLNATQIVLGATRRSRWAELTRGSVINRVIRDSGVGLDVHVISRADDGQHATTSRTRQAGSAAAAEGDAGVRARCRRPAPVDLGADEPSYSTSGSRACCCSSSSSSSLISAVGGVWPALSAAVVGLLARQLVLHPAHPYVHGRARRESSRALGLPRRRGRGQHVRLARRPAGGRRRPRPQPRQRRSPASPARRRCPFSSTAFGGSSHSTSPPSSIEETTAGRSTTRRVSLCRSAPTGRQVELDDVHVLVISGRRGRVGR